MQTANAAIANVDLASCYVHKKHMERSEPRNWIVCMRRLAGMVLLCAILLRSLIPGGFMPNFDAAEGQGFFIICTSLGEQRALQAGVDDSTSIDTHQHGLCAFAIVGTWIPYLLFWALFYVLLVRGNRLGLPPALTLAAEWLCRPPGARGPPLRA